MTSNEMQTDEDTLSKAMTKDCDMGPDGDKPPLLSCCQYDLRRRRKRPQWCSNCGKHGHNSKQCQFPVISCGFILFRRVAGHKIGHQQMGIESHNMDYFHLTRGGDATPKLQSATARERSVVQYLLVRRKDSLNFVEFIRGKYDPQDLKFLFQAFSEMSITERQSIASTEFKTLWRNLWLTSYTNISNTEFYIAENKFYNLMRGYYSYDGKFVSIAVLLEETTSRFRCPEWGFPKGKRNRRETDYECARREFGEETGCRPEDYTVLHQLDSVGETFKGSNDVFYKHIYYVACHKQGSIIETQLSNPEQMAEIGELNWFTAKQALELFRPYDVEKRALLMRLDNVLTNYQFTEEQT